MKRLTLAVLSILLLAPATGDAAFPGANGKIAFERGGDIWTMEPDGTGQVNLDEHRRGRAQSSLVPGRQPDRVRLRMPLVRSRST